MKLTYVIVTSIDGRTVPDSLGGDTTQWASHEDQEHFMGIADKAKAIIMGSTTYEHAKSTMKHRAGRKRIVMTRNPDKYTQNKIDGQLEFTNETPTELIARLQSEGHSEAFHFGGAHCASTFFKVGLVTHILQTLEPKLFGDGIGIVHQGKFNVSLELVKSSQLNKTGTLLLEYKVIK